MSAVPEIRYWGRDETMVLNRKPDFCQLEKVLAREVPDRYTPFEFMLDNSLIRKYAPELYREPYGFREYILGEVKTFERLGYDYAMIHASDFHFPTAEKTAKSTISLNDNIVIWDRDSFRNCPFMSPANANLQVLNEAAELLPEGMKLIICGPCGVLENVVAMVGYENLCMMLYDDEALVEDIFAAVGSRLVEYYSLAINHPAVGALMSNDDWGFNTQTMLSPADMRRYVFPWHKAIVEVAHKAGKPAMLHSCGYFGDIIDDVIDDMRYDARHSYEDTILPVEQAYEQLHDRIAVLGGIDVNFIATRTPEEIEARSKALLRQTAGRGGYALGTGNSVPDYVPEENYLAMHRCVDSE